jgi:hypothetical protein
MEGWRRYRKEKDAIITTECIGMTWILQRVRMYGCNLLGKKVQTCFGIVVLMPDFLQQRVWIKTAFL